MANIASGCDNTPRAYDAYHPLTLYHIKNNPPRSIYCLFSCCDERDVKYPRKSRTVFVYILPHALPCFLLHSLDSHSTEYLQSLFRIAAICFIQPYVLTPDPIMLTGPQIFSLPRNDRHSLPAVGSYCSS